MSHWDWLWLAVAIFGPLPLVWAWRWGMAWWSARNVRDVMEYRRRKFGGCMRQPGQADVTPLDRPD